LDPVVHLWKNAAQRYAAAASAVEEKVEITEEMAEGIRIITNPTALLDH